MPIISKLPQSEEMKLSEKIIKPSRQREFLTKPSSWAKLWVGFAIVSLVVWVNIRPAGKETRNKKQETNKGQVAGAQDIRTDNSELIIKNEEKDNPAEQKPAPMEGLPQIEFPVPKDITSELDKTILASEDIKLLFKTGSDALDKNDLDLAQLAYIRITQVAPEYKDAWYYLGYTYLKKFEGEPIIKYADPVPTNLDWSIVALNRAHLIAPLSESITQLLDKAIEIKKENSSK